MSIPDQGQCQAYETPRQCYNADVVSVRRPHSDLLVMRIRPDGGVAPLTAGQYATLGLGDWEPFLEDTDEATKEVSASGKLILRAYSVSATLLDDAGYLVRVDQCDYLEFYIALVRHSHRPVPSLTPRLFHLQPGDRIYCAPRYHGSYALGRIDAAKNVVFAATGTGEAPHNAMLAELLTSHHQGQIASVVCARYERDLAYLAVHRELERRYSNYRYTTLTTREAVNLDPSVPGYVGKQYLQEFFDSGRFDRAVGWSLHPANTEVFLCGSPEMIGAPLASTKQTAPSSVPTGMIAVLESRGFRVDAPHAVGNIHFEKYW